MTLTHRGKIQGGAIILPQPLRLPDGTEVVVRIETVLTAAPSEVASGSSDAVRREDLTEEELERYLREHPAPQQWWDADDDPFKS
jgi:hypothetical protein